MNLKVLQNETETETPWYGDGLRFTCAQCGNCCTGGPGYVWISKKEIQRLAKHLRMTTSQVIEQYCRPVGNKYSLKEVRNSHGEYDCIFLKEEKVGNRRAARSCIPAGLAQFTTSARSSAERGHSGTAISPARNRGDERPNAVTA